VREYKVEKDILYPELSFKLVGIAFEVFNKLGYGHREYVYQRLFSEILKAKGIPFVEQIRYKLIVDGKLITTYAADYLIDDKIIVDLKAKERFDKEDLRQVLGYLKESAKELAILLAFARRGVKFHRVLMSKIRNS